MRIRDTKTTFFMYFPYECTAVEEYLEQMAEKGWLLKSIKGNFFNFKKIEPKRVKYSVDVLNKVSMFDHKDSDVALEYREYCKAAGWTYVCESGKLQIFYTEEDTKVLSIHTDENEKFKAVFKASLYNILLQGFLIILFVYNLYIQLFLGTVGFVLSSNLGILSIVIQFSGIVIISIRVISFFSWVIKARRKLKENKFMPYNNYKQKKIKNILLKLYLSTMISLLIVIGNPGGKQVSIYVLSIMFISIIMNLCIKEFIDRKRYSKNINRIITSSSIIASALLISIIIGSTIVSNITGARENDVLSEKVSLTLMDFGNKEDYDKNPYVQIDKSMLAQRVQYIGRSEDKSLNYTILESKYPWVINSHENRLLSTNTKYGIDVKQENTSLPSNIKVYAYKYKYMERKAFILVSENKVVDIKNEFSDISDDEFLDKVYKNIF